MKNKYLYGRRNKFVKRKEKFQLNAIHVFTTSILLISLFLIVDTHAVEIKTNSKASFIYSLNSCIKDLNKTIPKSKQIPSELIVAQAVIETAWGKSRISDEANNLFGIRTWNENTPHMLLMDVEKWPGWGVRVFASKCDSVKEYIRILNEHPAYEKFRELRLTTNDPTRLIKTLDKYSTTADYDKRVIKVIGEIRKLEKQ